MPPKAQDQATPTTPVIQQTDIDGIVNLVRNAVIGDILPHTRRLQTQDAILDLLQPALDQIQTTLQAFLPPIPSATNS